MAKIDNEKLTAAKKTLRAEIEERRLQTFTPSDAMEGLRAEITDMAAVGYSIQEIEDKLKESLGLKQIPMSRVRKILEARAESSGTENQDTTAASAETTTTASQEVIAVLEVAAKAVSAVPVGQSTVATVVSAVKDSLTADSGESTRPASLITTAATVPPPQPLLAKKEEQDNGERVSESGG
jgi:hypothetical protein